MEMYWWMRASGSENVIVSKPFGAVSTGSGSPSRIAIAVPPSIPRISGVAEPRDPCSSECEQQLVRAASVRVVGREEDLLWCHLAHQVHQVDHSPERRVEEDPRNVREVTCQPAQVGDTRVGDDQANVGVAVDERSQVIPDRGQSTTAVDQNRDVALDREREDVAQAPVADRELLGARMELDPTGPEIEAADRLLDRPLLEIEPHERDDPIRIRCCVRERAVIGGGEGRAAVGLVETERERAGDAELVEHREHLVGAAAHSVDVVAEMGVRIEEHAAFGDIGERALRDLLEDQVRARQRIHGFESTAASATPGGGAERRRFRHRSDPGEPVVRDDRRHRDDAVAVGGHGELGRLDGGSVTRSEARAKRYASSTAGGQCGQVGVT